MTMVIGNISDLVLVVIIIRCIILLSKLQFPPRTTNSPVAVFFRDKVRNIPGCGLLPVARLVAISRDLSPCTDSYYLIQ